MVLRIYNTLTRKKEKFVPLKKVEVRMYVCGPTVNDVPHLGHARSQISFDVLRKYLEFIGFKVKFVSNITDIEDKIMKKAEEKGVSVKELSLANEKEHKEDYLRIGVAKPDVQPHATKYVKEMISLIKNLEKKGFTYALEDGVYYDISKFKDYGKLSGQKVKNLKSGARVKVVSGKKNDGDFVLWKFSDEKSLKMKGTSWKAPWGDGRPGWHIECSAMSEKILGLPLDIHGGGQDLIFPHHEDEIAQSEAGFGKKFAKYWVHNGMVNVDKVKMSKSLGNFTTIRDLLKNYDGEVIRYFVLATHYRQPLDFSKNALDDVKNAYERLRNILGSLESSGGKADEKFISEFRKAMDEDLNTPRALQVLWSVVRDKKISDSEKIGTVKKMDEVLGLNLFKKEKISVPSEIKDLVKKRDVARKEKNWKLADSLRDEIANKGYAVNDTEEGSVVKKI